MEAFTGALKNIITTSITNTIHSQFPYSQKKSTQSTPVWQLADGERNNSLFTIFSFKSSPSAIELVKNGCKKWKMIKHPNCLSFKDGYSNNSVFFVATEPVVIVDFSYNDDKDTQTFIWGLYQVATALNFLHRECNWFHGNVRLGMSIFAERSGEWKLGGFEMTGAQNEMFEFLNYRAVYPGNLYYPDVNDNFEALDAWHFGILIYEIFNKRVYTGSKEPGNIPRELVSSFNGFMNPNPKSRLTVSRFLETADVFNSPLIKMVQFLENITLLDSREREAFFRNLNVDNLPPPFVQYKLLPCLMNAVEFGTAGNAADHLVKCIFNLSTKIAEFEFENVFIPWLVRLYSTNDKSIKGYVLENTALLVKNLDKKAVNEKLFPALTPGFTDPMPLIREQTMKTSLLLVEKLSEYNINQELIRYLGKLQVDEQPGIRTNATIAIGKLAKYLNESTKKKVLLNAFTRSLRDPFPAARSSALLAIFATIDSYEYADLATQLIPCCSPLLIDQDPSIRANACKAISAALKRLELYNPEVKQEVKYTGALDWAMKTVTRTESNNNVTDSNPFTGSKSLSNSTSNVFTNSPSNSVSNVSKNGRAPVKSADNNLKSNPTESIMKGTIRAPNQAENANSSLLSQPMKLGGGKKSGWDDLELDDI